MPKTAVTVFQRAREYKDESFYVLDNKILMCRLCNCRLEFAKKDTLNKHLTSAKHVNMKARDQASARPSTSRQASIAEAIATANNRANDKEKFIVKTTEAFIAANIPVEKLDNKKMREWMKEYIPGSGDLPSANRIRQHYIPIVGKQHEENIKDAIREKKICVLSDETTDKGGRCVFNVLFRTLEPGAQQKTYMAASTVLDAANGANCANAILDTLTRYSVDKADVIAMVSDSARYMSTCFRTLQGLMPDLHHIQCWSHKMNLVGDIFQDILDDLNLCVVRVKSAFLNTRKRKNHYMAFLSARYPGELGKVKLFPSPVITRWNSWFSAVIYINEYLNDLIDFFRQLQDENAGIKYFKNLTDVEIKVLKVEALFTARHCVSIMEFITYFEGSSYPTAHLVSGKSKDIVTELSIVADGNFSQEVMSLLNQLSGAVRASTVATLKKTGVTALTKLNNLIHSDPSKKMFHSLAIFDARNLAKQSTAEMVQDLISNIPAFSAMKTDVLTLGLALVKSTVLEEVKKPDVMEVNITDLLCSLKASHAEFACAALSAIWIPPSNVDSERSFSKYSIVVTDRRRRLTAQNAEILTMVAFS